MAELLENIGKISDESLKNCGKFGEEVLGVKYRLVSLKLCCVKEMREKCDEKYVRYLCNWVIRA